MLTEGPHEGEQARLGIAKSQTDPLGLSRGAVVNRDGSAGEGDLQREYNEAVPLLACLGGPRHFVSWIGFLCSCL